MQRNNQIVSNLANLLGFSRGISSMRRIHSSPLGVPTIWLWVLEGLLIAACFGTLAYYSDPKAHQIGTATLPLTVLMPLAVIGLMHWGGLYDFDALLNLRRAVWRSGLIAVPIFALAVAATGQLAKNPAIPIYPFRWQWTIALTALWWGIVVAFRALLYRIHKAGWLTQRILVVGTTKRAATLSALSLETNSRFSIAGCIDADTNGSSPEARATLESRLCTLAAEKKISEVVVASREDGDSAREIAAICRKAGLEVASYLDFFEREGGRILVDELGEQGGALTSYLCPDKKQPEFQRAFDVIFALAAIVATAPVMLMTALSIKLEDGGRVLYRQERVGLAGRTFAVLKFRSMREDAERDGTPTWAAERDSRITKVGRIIRMFRIDELPQFFNVLQGDMAIIGPRPERPYFVAQFVECIPFYSYRHAVRPGITGWAQVKFRYGASVDDTKRKLSYDLFYIKNRGLLLDLIILMKTIGVVLRGEGAR